MAGEATGGRPDSRRRAGGDEAFWRALAARVLAEVPTPCFLFAAEPIAAELALLDAAFEGLPVRHWWSCKTLPLRPALRWWKDRGRPVEVVSEFELRTALELGFRPEDILINGPAKHTWLGRHPVPGLRVNLDSPAEAAVLLPLAGRLGWHLGVRVNTRGEENAEYPGIRAQFGMVEEELAEVAVMLRRAALDVGLVHFHLRTNVRTAADYREALAEALSLAAGRGWRPAVLDLGGGFPARAVGDRRGRPLDAAFSLAEMRAVIEWGLSQGCGAREVWLENGRRLAASGGVLAVRVLDEKKGRGIRTLVCDGGRTLHALVATWERHRVIPMLPLGGGRVRTLVCGPTCMAFDNLGRHDLPAGVGPGDVLLWLQAGAYQLSWETRFSHGLAPVVWAGDGPWEVVRPAEGFAG